MAALASYFNALECSVTQNLKNANIKTRSGASNGLWCCVLLPLILLASCFRYPVSPIYQLTSVVSLGLLLSSMLLISFLSVSASVLSEGKHYESLASGIVASLVCVWLLGRGLIFSVALCVTCTYVYIAGVVYALTALPLCFTVGEAMVALQGMVIFAASAVANIMQALNATPHTDEDIIALIVQAGLMTVAVIITLVSRIDGQRHPQTLLASVGGSIVALLLFLHAALGQSSLLWVLGFVANFRRMALVAWWAALVCASTLAVRWRMRAGRKASSAARKVFHYAAAAVLLPGALLDVDLMTLAAGVAFALLLLVEALRKSKIEPFSSALEEAYDVYADEKDCGGLSLTPLYLMAGVACPLALVAPRRTRELQLLAGALSAGVGDAAASSLGSRVGRHRWPGSNRTLEGTFFNITSQFFTVYLLVLFGYLPHQALWSSALSSVVSGLVEAKTDQVDNMVLPLITLLSLILF